MGLKNTFLKSFEGVPGAYVRHYHYATSRFREVAGVHRGFPEVRPYLIETTASNLSTEWTAGGMIASASGLVRWAQALRDGDLLGREMHREAFTYHSPRERRGVRRQYL